MYGWRGTVLRVNLTEGKVHKQLLGESAASNFIGGRGLNSMTLFREVQPGADPLGSENVLCLSPGPLTGTALALSSRIEVSTLSPLSGILGDGSAGGFFPTYLKRAGHDQIVITGKAASPKYLWIDDDSAELRDALPLRGKTTWATTDMLRKIHGRDIHVACIGQAGENLVRFASTIVDKYCSAAPGSGAVWGSKNLKAIAVRGTGEVKLADPNGFRALALADRKFLLKENFQREVVATYGTHIGMAIWRPPYRYYQERLPGDRVPEALRPHAWKQFEVRRGTCYGCPIRCKDVYKIPEGKRAGEMGSGLEYETIAILGTNCGIEDPIAIMEMGNLADAYGMDSIALGNAISFAKELYHRQIITEEDTDGLSLDWVNIESQIELIHQIALREGFGNLVAEGMYGLAKKVGKGAIDYCYHVKGGSRGPHTQAQYAGLCALADATSTRGSDHLRGRNWLFDRHDPVIFLTLVKMGMLPPNMAEDPGKWLIIGERAATLADTIGRCKGAVNSWACAVPLVWKYPLWDGWAKLMTSATGFEFDSTTLEAVADRIYALEMAFNARQGITREDGRLLQRPEMRGTPEGEEQLWRHEEILTEYYRSHGCDIKTGIPTRETQERLGLKYVADELEHHGPYPKWDGPPLWPLDSYPHWGVRC